MFRVYVYIYIILNEAGILVIVIFLGFGRFLRIYFYFSSTQEIVVFFFNLALAAFLNVCYDVVCVGFVMFFFSNSMIR